MTTKSCSKKRHTPIVSERQRGLFGAELSRRRSGEGSRMAGITTTELENHLRESKGKDLPKSSYPGGFRKRKYHG